jgi:tetratricopeptide (TPR) repeat protein
MSKHASSKTLRLQATVILTLFFIAVAGFAALGWWYAREATPHQGPIVVLSVDGLKPSDLAAYNEAISAEGSPADDTPAAAPAATLTPALDSLAGDAVVFERAYTHSPLALPAHASLLSGRLPFEHGVRDEAGFVLDPSVRTLAELLRDRGFATGAAVSSYFLRRSTGIAQGFTSYAESPRLDLPADAYLVPLATRPPYLLPPGSGSDPLAAALSAAAAEAEVAAIDDAERWAKAQNGQRYFLFLEVGAARAEEAVSRISWLLKEERLYEEATIVLVGSRSRTEDASLDEDTLRVPLLVKQPNRENAGRRVTVPVQHIDLLPTILDLVRAPTPSDLGGRSLQGLLTDEDARIVARPIYAESLADYLRFGGHPQFALAVNEARYVRDVTERIERLENAGEAPVQPLEGSPDGGAADAIVPMRATLDRALTGHPVSAPMSPGKAEAEGLALAGYLPGLRPVLDSADVRVRDAAAQRALAQAHRRAATLVGQRRLPAAMHVLHRIVREQPTLASVHYQIGLLAAVMGRSREAIAALETASSLRSNAPEIPRALAAALAADGRTADAGGLADLAVSIAQTFGPGEVSAAHQQAARIALLRKDRESALQHADAAQAANPAVPMRSFVEGRLLVEAGRDEDAVKLLQEAAAMLHQHDTALEGLHTVLATALARLNRPEDAEAAYREELRAFPGSLTAHAGLVGIAAASQDDDRIDEAVKSLLASAPTPQGYAVAARVLADAGAVRRAEALRSDAQVRFRGDPALARLRARDTQQ